MKVLVTGAAGGIGAATVQLAVERGHAVIATDQRFGPGHEGLDQVTQVECDLTRTDDLDALAEAARELGVEAVIAAHGVVGAGALEELDDDRVRTILAVNAGAVPALFGAVRDTLRQNRGRFVVVTSIAALRGERENSAYCASKWAAQAWVGSMDAAEGPDGIAVRVLCPGRTDTEMLRRGTATIAEAVGQTVEEYTETVMTQVPLRRYGRPREQAAAALYLAGAGVRAKALAVTGGETTY